MGRRTIDKWTWDYWLVQSYVKLCYKLFYKKILVINSKNIPVNTPVILAPNHQNALMDALVFVCNTKSQPVFLARSDIFKGKLLTHFLNFLNMIPVFRIRDGLSNVRKNNEIFEKTLQVLRNKYNPLCLFPEGNHGDRRKLRAINKGIFRIAFMAQQDYKNNPGVKIIPVGIDYSDYENCRSNILINFGNSIEVSDFYKIYKEDVNAATNQLRIRFEDELKKLMINITNDEYYELYCSLRKIYNSRMRILLSIKGQRYYDCFNADKKMIECLDLYYKENKNEFTELNKLVLNYFTGLKKYKIRDWLVEKGEVSIFELIYTALFLLFSLPVATFGIICNILPLFVTSVLIKKVKDTQFLSSFRFVLGLVLYPLNYILISIVFSVFFLNSGIVWTFIPLMIVTGIITFDIQKKFKKLWGMIRFWLTLNRKKDNVEELIIIKNKIKYILDTIVKRYI